MIVSDTLRNASPIILSLLAIAYLMLFELGSEKIKKTFLPFLIVLIAIFAIIAITSVYQAYVGIK